MLDTKGLLAKLVEAVVTRHAYGTCATAAATAAKVVTCSGFVRSAGARVAVKFTYSNTAATPTINVNSTGAAEIRVGSSTAVGTGAMWQAGDMVEFIFDGTYWQIQGRKAVLYNDSSGTNGDVALAKTAANYNHMRIYFTGTADWYEGTYDSSDVFEPNGKRVGLNLSAPSSTGADTKKKIVTISGTSISNYNTNYSTEYIAAGGYGYGHENHIKVTRVEAWSE